MRMSTIPWASVTYEAPRHTRHHLPAAMNYRCQQNSKHVTVDGSSTSCGLRDIRPLRSSWPRVTVKSELHSSDVHNRIKLFRPIYNPIVPLHFIE